MAAGEKVLELRKSKPQCKAPFRVLVYVTGGVGVVGEFVCPEVLEIKNFEEAEKKSRVPAHDIHNYAAGSRNKVYGWEITAVKEYPQAVALEELGMKRAPQIQREKIAAKLKKIKALAERGVGGEKETAMRMYEDLKARYELEDEEIMLDAVTLHWFGYATELEEELLTQIFYKVTGGTTYHIYTGKYSRRKKRGCDCTEIEAAEITLLFNFYKAELKRELEAFMVAFRSGNNLYPDKTARCYKENNGPAPERTDEEKRMLKKAAWYSQVLDKRRPPRALIGEPEVEED